MENGEKREEEFKLMNSCAQKNKSTKKVKTVKKKKET